MFAKCVVQAGSTKDALKCVQIDPPGHDEVFDVPQTNAWNVNSQVDPLTYGDIGMLPHTNIPCVLDFLKVRFMKNQIYTTADPLVVAINPFRDLGNTTVDWIIKYRDTADLTKLPPHVFYTARRALDNLHSVKKSQTIIVSGRHELSAPTASSCVGLSAKSSVLLVHRTEGWETERKKNKSPVSSHWRGWWWWWCCESRLEDAAYSIDLSI